MKKLALVLSIIFIAGSTAALTQSELDQFKDKYNNQTSEVPSIVGSIVGGERLNVHVNNSNGTEVIGADMDGVEINSLTKGGFENQTMNVYTNEDTVEGILESDDPFDQVTAELDAKNITYDSTTTGGKVKITVFKSLKGLANLFGLSF